MPQDASEKACTVTQAVNAAKRSLENIKLTVIGEISEFNDKPGYKAAYFTIRDDDSSMSCMMWRDRYRASGVELRPGALVELTGKFSCYPKTGRMQFSVSSISLAGEGKLRMQVAQIARKLDAEGLTSPTRKRRTPALPRRIAVITSPRGKAVHDVIRTLHRRYPLGELLLFGVPVEGANAPAFMMEALDAANSCSPAPDVILLVRGGGSYEDLMPFNDEALARAVAASNIPVVTGIGHEPDNSLCDMVSDMRCSTPTAAAEAVAPSLEELQQKVDNATQALGNALASVIDNARARLVHLQDRPLWHDPHYITASYLQTLDLASERLERAIPDSLAASASKFELLQNRLRNALPGTLTQQARAISLYKEHMEHVLPKSLETSAHSLTLLQNRLRHALPNTLAQQTHAIGLHEERMRHIGLDAIERHAQQLAIDAAKLNALSPLKTLSRGYSITYATDGHTVIDSIAAVAPDQEVHVQVADGSINCTVISVEGK